MKSKVTETKPDSQKDSAFLLSAPEISVFVACCVMANEMRGLERSLETGEMSPSVFAERSKTLLERLAEAADATQRFDVVLPVIESAHFSPFFWRWFNWWNDYLKGLTPSQVAETERRTRENGKLIEDLRPKGHWINYSSTPAIRLEDSITKHVRR